MKDDSTDFTLLLRVLHKSHMSTGYDTRNNRQYKTINIFLGDDTRQIMLLAFDRYADFLNNQLELDGCYYIRDVKVSISAAVNPFFRYRLTCTSKTKCRRELNASINYWDFDFIPINEIADIEAKSTVDILGVVHEVGDLMEIKRYDSSVVDRRNITLVDKSMSSINLSLWDSNATLFSARVGNVVALKNMLVKDYGGK